MAKKSKKTLTARIAKLKERGVRTCLSFDTNHTVAELLDVLGDLTLEEFCRMVQIENTEAAVEGTLALAKRKGTG